VNDARGHVTELLEPLELLYEVGGPPIIPLPEELETAYGGQLRLDAECVVANFVSSLDGVVAITTERQSSSIVSDRSAADRFVMGLLRASADAVLIGSGTMRASPASRWKADGVYPPFARLYAAIRESLGMQAAPVVAVLTASGSIDVDHPALGTSAVVLTTKRGAERLHDRLPPGAGLVALDGVDRVDPRSAIEVLRARGHRRILSEAGPNVTGSLLSAGLVDELFLTVSPLVAGRGRRRDRLGLVEGHAFLPGVRVAGRLTGVRRHGEHLFLRYRLGRELSLSRPAARGS
jgi:riboflavin biosynthesis pyrimidine reductase